MKKFSTIYKRAAKRKGGEEALEALMPKVATARALSRKPGHRYLSAMTNQIMKSGFQWKIVEHMWDGFEEALEGFDVARCAAIDDEALSELLADARVIKHRGKLESIRNNAMFIAEIEQEHGGFGKMLSKWPDEDLVGLWQLLKERGSRLGGATGPMFLRQVGKDTFLLTRDVGECLVTAGAIDHPPKTSKKDLALVQAAFNRWREETGWTFAELSRIAACSVP